MAAEYYADVCFKCVYCGREGKFRRFCFVAIDKKVCYCICERCRRNAFKKLPDGKIREKIYDKYTAGDRIHT